MHRPDRAHLVRQVLSERILEMRLLEELTLTRFYIAQEEQGEAFLEICQRLKVLELGRTTVDVVIPSRARRMRERGQGYVQEQEQETSGDSNAEPFTLPRLRKLILDRVTMGEQQQLALWKACTHLEDLTWVVIPRLPRLKFPIADICNHLAKPSSLSMVQSLVRLNINGNTISDQSFSRLLDLLPNLEALAANRTHFGPLSLVTLLGDESPEIKGNNVNQERANHGRVQVLSTSTSVSCSALRMNPEQGQFPLNNLRKCESVEPSSTTASQL
ncbi:hypothetical protein BGZ95_009853 [Linnemannia exigua]|uniref:Uncharacterized protein n=1 Tax=Linnemannia exigua TaxID=604196 RepID=A0AAD4DCN4_9FUNG|nr:hypothetical protein BGZ95_009853 [Linnemannia exigua]